MEEIKILINQIIFCQVYQNSPEIFRDDLWVQTNKTIKFDKTYKLINTYVIK